MKTRLLIGLVVASVLAASLPGTAWAAPGQPAKRGGLLIGQVMAIEGGRLDVQSRRGEAVKVQTDAQTRFRVRGVRNPSVGDIKVGDVIAVRGRWTDDVLYARQVWRVPPNLRDQVAGKLTSIEDSVLVLEDKDGRPVRVQTVAITLFNNPDKPAASFDDIQVGDFVTAVGVKLGDTLTAARVTFKTPQARQPGPIVLGEVTAVAGSTLTLKQPYGESLTINTDASTFVVRRGEEGDVVDDVSSLKVGDKILAIGPRSADDSQLDARVIVVK